MRKHFINIFTLLVLAGICCFVSADEEIKINIDKKNWKIVLNEELDQGYNLEYIPKYDNADNWTEKISIYKKYGARGRPDVIVYGMKAGLDEKYPYVVSDMIREFPNDVMYELYFGSGPGELEQNEIGRIMKKEKTLWMLSYVTKKTPLSSKARQKWIDLLENATIIETSEK